MFAMPLVIAQQLVADRRASYENVAAQHRFRRRASRRPVDDLVGATPLPRRAPLVVVLPPDTYAPATSAQADHRHDHKVA